MAKNALGQHYRKVVPATAACFGDATFYTVLPNHHAVKYSALENAPSPLHTGGTESVRSTLKRANQRSFRRLSPKHLHRSLDRLLSHDNMRAKDTLNQAGTIMCGMDVSLFRDRESVA